MPGLASVALAIAALLQESPARRPLEVGVSAERVLIDVRVLRRSRAVPGLDPEHFRVRIDGQPAELLSVTWLSAEASPSPPDRALPPPAEPPGGRPRGRHVVLFVQKDLHRTRAPGMLRLLREARRLVERLGPDDRAAVLSFDTHLKLWQDFTSDPEELRRALEHDVLFEDRPPRVAASGDSSLAARIRPWAARRAASPETALRLIGEALLPITGSKTLVFMGWGLGELRGPTVSLHPDYSPARQSLLEAGVAVFTLDVTDADHHTLELGLQQVAEDTGGFYARTHLFTGGALARLDAALAGHYVLEVAHPGGRRGRHELRVDLVGHGGEVLARSAYFD